MDFEENRVDWDPQFDIIKDIIEKPFVQKYIDFLIYKPWQHGFIIKNLCLPNSKRRMDHGFFPWSFLRVMT